ncbi:MAG: hypothetical protein RBS39_13160 [Phycisphaerales bacterium]|jgi:hypothetical protein|nr:hypothetical protein [Phycisphaerales bacterium]
MSNVLVGATVVVIAGFAGAFLYQQYEMEHQGDAERAAREAELSQQRIVADEVAKLTRAATTTPQIASLDAAKMAQNDPTGEIAKIASMVAPLDEVSPEDATPEQVMVSAIVYMARADWDSLWNLTAPEFQREFEVSIRRTAMDPSVPAPIRSDMARKLKGKSGKDIFVDMFRENGEVTLEPGTTLDPDTFTSVINGDEALATGPGPDGTPETFRFLKRGGAWRLDWREQFNITPVRVSTAPN